MLFTFGLDEARPPRPQGKQPSETVPVRTFQLLGHGWKAMDGWADVVCGRVEVRLPCTRPTLERAAEGSGGSGKCASLLRRPLLTIWSLGGSCGPFGAAVVWP